MLLGIVREDTPKAVRDWVKDEGCQWPVGFDPGGKASLDFGTRGQPETYAIGPDGVVVASKFGPVTPAVLDQMVAYAQGRARPMRRWFPWIVLGVLVIGALAYATWPRGGDESLSAHTRRIASEIRCVDCEGLSVADSATQTAGDPSRHPRRASAAARATPRSARSTWTGTARPCC